jgi:uncharacterized protein YjiS (DUF1127 family)
METDMRIYFPVLPIGAATVARALAFLSTAFAQQLKVLARARRHRRDAAALAGLDRRMLKDIGITRSDLNDAFSSPFWEDPTSLLRERAIERRLNRVSLRGIGARRTDPEPGFSRPKLDRPARQAV